MSGQAGASQSSECSYKLGKHNHDSVPVGNMPHTYDVTATFEVIITHKDAPGEEKKIKTECYRIVIDPKTSDESEDKIKEEILKALLLFMDQDAEEILQEECEKRECKKQ